ncbi:hypothetical protein EPA93_23300 [Ktedonosporobacter rubrisoli]|uniref:WD40 repeat domain-containing protein n=1 Tax=Ktedonosporobacter rubrisoli TaxID=2509675 RepID=A0A4V0YZ76_KTERU|nr:hypothetical protein [Ktedonosporobacter rubrisoli]QBD78751.1 hypothetical protein EPA93_23300 [Ktedonosporobacter rubrisoli]
MRKFEAFMTCRKISNIFLLFTYACFALLSSCSSPQSAPSAPQSGQTSLVTSPASPRTNPTTVPTSSSASAFPADCPPAGTTRTVNLPTDTGPAQPAVFYLTEWGGVQSGFHLTGLMRYDLTTHKTTTLLSFPGITLGTWPQFELSPDKHWLLFAYSNADRHDITRLQLLRTDGTQVQTLACFSETSAITSVHWLSAGERIVLTKEQYDQQQPATISTLEELNLTSGKAQTLLSGQYFPYLWLDDHRLIVEQTTSKDRANFFLLDTNKGSQQKLAGLTPIASFPTWGNFVYGAIATSPDGSQLFTSSFAQVGTNPLVCRGPAVQGPETLTATGSAGGSTHVIYSSQSLAILALHPASAHILLLYVENNTGDLSQNGLWKINTDGSGLMRLTSAKDEKCRDLDYRELSPQIASNYLSYAVLQTDSAKGEQQAIIVGSLSGGPAIPIASSTNIRVKANFNGFLQLVGMA